MAGKVGGVMVRGGCTCKVWQNVMNPKHPAIEEHHRELRKNIYYDEEWVFYSSFMLYCPWCGSPLTPPEEDGNEAE